MAVNKVTYAEEKQTIEIGVIGGPFDRITTVLQEFEPGQKDFIIYPEQCGIAPRTVAEATEREVEVTIPARLHPTVLDMNRFNTSRPGGGGMGIGDRGKGRAPSHRHPFRNAIERNPGLPGRL